VGFAQSFIRGRIWKNRVRRKVVLGTISGRTAKAVSPTRPRVTLVRASWFTERPRWGATVRAFFIFLVEKQ